ncbi:Crp/Fnr family transcriptional regulator [Shinella sp. M31]|uniref:Crp/Fnr family transcriptional regulator n=1 Tax=Shinella sp. M31 TaxID=3368615 RepID=UPI003BA2622B
MGSTSVEQSVSEIATPSGCNACEARGEGICGVLSPQQLARLAKHSKRRTIAAGCELVSQGEEAATYSNVLSGVLKLAKTMADGRQQIVGLQFAPSFAGRPYSHRSAYAVEAASETRICTFPRQPMDLLALEVPELGHRLHEQALSELDEAREWMLTLGRKDALEKISTLLLYMARRLDPGDHDKKCFELSLSRQEIGDYLGLTIETVSRQFTRLRKLRAIELENLRLVRVPNVGRLASLASVD